MHPNLSVTSRPIADFSAFRNLDLELETVGFYPNQVNHYIERVFTNPEKAETDQKTVDEIQSFLKDHWLIRGLVRIPIQLDELCYTWGGRDSRPVPETMTSICSTIVQRLWNKDAVRLDKMIEGKTQSARPAEIERDAKTEIALIECLGFNGLHSDLIDFTPAHRDEIVNMIPLPKLRLDSTLARRSFLRTSDPLSRVEDRNYHFIHLTIQEYFAVRYFGMTVD